MRLASMLLLDADSNYFIKGMIFCLAIFSCLTTCPFISEITHWLVKIPSQSLIQKIKTRIYIKTEMKINTGDCFESLHGRVNCDHHCQNAVSEWLRLSTEEPIAITFYSVCVNDWLSLPREEPIATNLLILCALLLVKPRKSFRPMADSSRFVPKVQTKIRGRAT